MILRGRRGLEDSERPNCDVLIGLQRGVIDLFQRRLNRVGYQPFAHGSAHEEPRWFCRVVNMLRSQERSHPVKGSLITCIQIVSCVVLPDMFAGSRLPLLLLRHPPDLVRIPLTREAHTGASPTGRATLIASDMSALADETSTKRMGSM